MLPTVGFPKKGHPFWPEPPSPSPSLSTFWLTPLPPDLGRPLWMPTNGSEWNRVNSVLSVVTLSVVKFQTTSRIVATLVTKNVAKWIQSQFSPKFCLKGAFFFYRYECTDKNAFWQCKYVGPINPAQVAKKVLRKEAKIIGHQKLPYIPETVDIFGYTC